MPQIINTNIASLNAQRNLDRSQEQGDTALERLSSGLRINSAADDAAGLAISTRFESQTQGLEVGIRNANDGISLSQTAEGALGSMTENLQRIRELSLQSANATNSAQDRESLNQEVQELKAEIDRVSKQTNFNGTTLLDGSFEGATFQIGANRGETVSVNVSGATPDDLGAAKTDGITSSPSSNAMQGGDLVINGFSIPASEAGSDTTSSNNNSASAIAKAAAVNERTDKTGVKAVVNETSVTGTDIGGTVQGSSGDITLNGIDITLPPGASGDEEGFLNSVASKINENSGQTGVEASFNGDPSVGIQLTAEDGRNIELQNNGANPSDYGLATADTYTGTYTLISEDGSDIDLTSDGDISRSGFQVGSFSGSNSGAAGQIVGASAMASGDITINDVPIGKSVDSTDTASPNATTPASSAIAKAAAINASSEATGVTASANQTLYTGGAISDDVDATFDVNGANVSVSIPSGADSSERQTAVVDAINAKSGQTGVTAEAFTDGSGNDTFRLVAEDGRNIQVDNFTFTTGSSGDLGFGGTVTQRASVSLESAGQIEIGTLTGNNDSAGFEVGSYGSNESGQLLRDVDISTVEGANQAITSIDNALDQVNRQRANFGAIQNRFESTIDNQEVANENLTAANSRIRDADFAKQSAELARTQTLQQAGISVLSQANQRPQQVLQLLQG